MATRTISVAGGNFSATGTWVEGVVPTAADDVIALVTSGNLTVDVNSVCRSIDFTHDGVVNYLGTFTINAGVTLSIGDGTAGQANVALDFSAGMTVTLGNATTSAISFVSTSTTQQTVTTAGKTLGNVTFNGTGGKWQLQDGLTVGSSASVTLTNGTFDTNGKTCSWGSLVLATGTKTLTLGASAITCSGTTPIDLSSGSNPTFTANTATITCTGSGATFRGGSANWNGTSFVFAGSGTVTVTNGTTTVANFTRTGTATKTDGLTFNSPLTVTGICTLGGGSTQGVNRLLIQTDTVGTQRTITAAAYVINGDVDFVDINLAYSGGASWTNTGSAYIGDCQGNAGAVTVNANASVQQTATGTASFTWSTHGWTTRVPLPQDDVVINNAFVGGQTITADMQRMGRSIDMSGCTGSPVFAPTTNCSIFGSLAFATGMTWTMTSTFFPKGRGAYTITTNGVTPGSWFQFQAPGGTYTFIDNYASLSSADAGLQLDNGTLDASSGTRNITVSAFSSNNSNTRTLKLGSGTWTLSGRGETNFWLATSTLTLVAGTAVILYSAFDATARNFQGSSLIYPTLRATALGSNVTITGNPTFTNLDLECTTARTVTFPASGTVTVTGTFTLKGAAGQLLSVVSSTPGTGTIITVGPGGVFAGTNYSLSADVTVKIAPNVLNAHPVAVLTRAALT